jgi:DHA1 family bicyclomycin/chloramphenicol resistance-like MFS transporter
MLRPETFALTALLAALTAIGPLSTDMYMPSLPDIGQQLVATPAQVQLTLSSFLVGFAFGQVVYGPISDRHGRKPVLLAALGLFIVASAICALSTSIEMLIAARALQAFGGSGCAMLARAIVRDLYSGNRAGRELSVMGSTMALAPVIAPVIGGLLQTAFGWRSNFDALLAVGIAGVATIWLLLPETLRRRGDPISPASMLRSYGIVARHPAYLSYMGLATGAYAGLFAWISGASFVLQGLYGLTPMGFGIAFALSAVGYLTGTNLAARLVMRIGLDRTIGFGCCALAAGGLGTVASLAFGLTSVVSLVFPVSIYLVGLGMVLPQSIAGAMTPFPERAGVASAMFGFIQQSVAAICGATVGLLLGSSAWPVAGAIALMGVATLLLWILTRGIRARAIRAN